MKTSRALVAAVAVLAAAACGGGTDGPPRIDVDRTACSHCGMLISEPLYAAASQAPGSAPRVFDDIKCLVDAAGQPGAAIARVWLHDAASAAWIDGHGAVIVKSPALRTPMGGGLIAFRDRAAAREAAANYDASVLTSLDRLMADARPSSDAAATRK